MCSRRPGKNHRPTTSPRPRHSTGLSLPPGRCRRRQPSPLSPVQRRQPRLPRRHPRDEISKRARYQGYGIVVSYPPFSPTGLSRTGTSGSVPQRKKDSRIFLGRSAAFGSTSHMLQAAPKLKTERRNRGVSRTNDPEHGGQSHE